MDVAGFVESLKNKPTESLFNPWFENDPHHDARPDAPEIRKRQLQNYLTERLDSAKYLFIAEALGYQGGHFSGIAMTSERILLGHQREKYGIRPDHVIRKNAVHRTSSENVNSMGMSEPTATIMWGAIIESGINPHETVLWNAVPWHPFNPAKGLLSNRTPTQPELEEGYRYLNQFLEIFPGRKVIAVGRKCEESMNHLGIDHIAVRHPANGGAPKFREQLKEIIRNGNSI